MIISRFSSRSTTISMPKFRHLKKSIYQNQIMSLKYTRVVTLSLSQGGSLGHVVIGGGSCSEGVGLNPSAVYWMDMTFFHIDLLEIVMMFV